MSSYFQCLFTTFNILICITKLFLFIIWLNLATTWLYLLYLCSRSQASIVQFFCRELWQCDLGSSPSHCILHMYIPVYMQQTMKYFKFPRARGRERESSKWDTWYCSACEVASKYYTYSNEMWLELFFFTSSHIISIINRPRSYMWLWISRILHNCWASGWSPAGYHGDLMHCHNLW